MTLIDRDAFRALLGHHEPAMPPFETWTGPGDVEILVALARHFGCRRGMEFGTHRGATARAVMDNCPQFLAWLGIDVPPTHRMTLDWQQREMPERPGEFAMADPRYDLMLPARGSFDLTPDDLGLPGYDFAFIDGDHSFEAVMHDIALARAVVGETVRAVGRPGIIAAHDYTNGNCPEVTQAIDELNRTADRFIHVRGTMVAYEVIRP